MDNNKYKAFICYSRSDSKQAIELQKYLERFKIPKPLAEKSGSLTSLRPVFRDQTELTSGNLDLVIDQALEQSSALIVICSPSAAKSKWVNQEILRFKQLHGSVRIFPLIVKGTPHSKDEDECFPLALLRSFDESGELTDEVIEPLASNIQELGGRRDAYLRIAAALLGVGFDQLKQREQRRKQFLYSASTTGAIAIAAITTYLAVVANLAQSEAELSREQADELISFMVGDLRKKLEPIGQVDVLDEVGNKAMEYFASLPLDTESSILSKRAMSLRQIGEVRILQGRYDDGLQSFYQAMEIYQELLAVSRSDEEALFELALTHFWIADAHFRRLDYEQAEVEILNYRNVSRELSLMYPDNNDYLLELGSAESNLGTLAFRKGEFELAQDRFESAVSTFRKIVHKNPDVAIYYSTLATALSWLGSTKSALGNYQEGTLFHEEMIAIGRQTVELNNDVRERANLARDLQVLARDYFHLGNVEGALTLNQEALEIFSELTAFDTANNSWAYELAYISLVTARHKISACSIDGTQQLLDNSEQILQKLISIDSASVYSNFDLYSIGLERARLAELNGNSVHAIDTLISNHSGLESEHQRFENDIRIRRDYLRASALLARLTTDNSSKDKLKYWVDSFTPEYASLISKDAIANSWFTILSSELEGEYLPNNESSSYYKLLIPNCEQ